MLGAGMAFTMLLIAVLLLFSAFFSAAETALTAVSRARLHRLKVEGNKRAMMVSNLRTNKESLIGTVMLGYNMISIAASAIATGICIKIWGEQGIVYVTFIMTILVVIFGEVMPKTYAINHPEKVAMAIAPAFTLIVRLLTPFTKAIHWLITILLKCMGVDLKAGTSFISATDVLRGTIELQHSEGAMVKTDRDMLGGILDLAERDVSNVMIHRKNVTTINADLPPKEIVRLAVESQHSRLPLWREDPDNIIGILHIRDLMYAVQMHGSENLTPEILTPLLAKPWFIPETTSLRDQLSAFRRKRQHFAFVVDEYGALLGIVTLEDILEEIVGEIDDEHDQPINADILPDGTGGYSVDGAIPIRDLNRYLDWKLPEEDATTIAGLALHVGQMIPESGQILELPNYRMTVLSKDGNRLTRLRIEKIEPAWTDHGV